MQSNLICWYSLLRVVATTQISLLKTTLKETTKRIPKKCFQKYTCMALTLAYNSLFIIKYNENYANTYSISIPCEPGKKITEDSMMLKKTIWFWAIWKIYFPARSQSKRSFLENQNKIKYSIIYPMLNLAFVCFMDVIEMYSTYYRINFILRFFQYFNYYRGFTNIYCTYRHVAL